MIESRFFLIEIEQFSSGSFPCYEDLNPDRPTVFKIFERKIDQFGNVYDIELIICKSKLKAKELLRSCRLTEGILIEEK